MLKWKQYSQVGHVEFMQNSLPRQGSCEWPLAASVIIPGVLVPHSWWFLNDSQSCHTLSFPGKTISSGMFIFHLESILPRSKVHMIMRVFFLLIRDSLDSFFVVINHGSPFASNPVFFISRCFPSLCQLSSLPFSLQLWLFSFFPVPKILLEFWYNPASLF